MNLDQDLIGRNPAVVLLRQQIRILLAQAAELRRLPPLLLTGETGTGKGLLARIIHDSSSRAAGQFVELSGATIPEHLLESELFGYEAGAYTDARKSKPGLLQVAHQGTLFLDEVALLPLSLQGKLLKVLEDDSVRRLGSTHSVRVDVAIISATNADLAELVRTRHFREDLYHRLAIITLAIPPLRERGDDIDLLADHAVGRACAKYRLSPKTLSPQARDALRGHRWPGNVRELNGLMERAVLFCPTEEIPAGGIALGPTRRSDAPEITRTAVESFTDERSALVAALGATNWNISRTAARLDITRNTVRAWIKKFGLGRGSLIPAVGELRAGAESRSSASGEGVAARTVGADLVPRRPTDLLPGRPSIAVLPFHVEDESDTRAYFGDGIVEDVIGALAALREVLVISRSSTLRYRGAAIDVREVARDLGVTYALTGSVRRSGHRLRVSVELAETAQGAVVWASHFDGIAEDLFALQDQIATRVVSTIAPHVREAQLRRALRKRPDSLEAYDCVLRGLAQLYRLNREDFAEARIWLEKAIALDAAYATPYALLAIWHSIRFGQGWSSDEKTDHAEVVRLAAAALQRDSYDATALALCGHAKSILLHEFDEAIALFDRALTASPNSALAWTRSSPTYSYIGEGDEAIRRAEQGLRLSPFDPHVFYTHTILGLAFYVAGQYEEAARWGRVAREEKPEFTANLRLLAASLGAQGRTEEARDAATALLALDPRFHVDRFVATYAIRAPERRDLLTHHLRIAGLPG